MVAHHTAAGLGIRQGLLEGGRLEGVADHTDLVVARHTVLGLGVGHRIDLEAARHIDLVLVGERRTGLVEARRIDPDQVVGHHIDLEVGRHTGREVHRIRLAQGWFSRP